VSERCAQYSRFRLCTVTSRDVTSAFMQVDIDRSVVTRFFRFFCLRRLTPDANSSFPLSIVFYVVGPGHITSENVRTRVSVCCRVVTRFFPLFSPQVTNDSCPQQFSAVYRLIRCRSRPHHLGERTHQGPPLSPRRTAHT